MVIYFGKNKFYKNTLINIFGDIAKTSPNKIQIRRSF